MIKAVLCSERLPISAVEKLSALCEKVFLLPSDEMLDDAVCHHPDMILSVIGNKIICHKLYFEKNKKFMTSLCEFGGLVPVLSETVRGKTYPQDVAFNVLVTDEYVYCNEKHTAKEVLNCAQEHGLRIVNVAQGYAACSCLVAENTVITSDTSIASAAKGKNEVVHTKGGGISLEPYDTGFIGGATGYFGGVLYTFGDLNCYNGAKEVLDFADEKGITVCPLLEGALCDFGGIKFIK